MDAYKAERNLSVHVEVKKKKKAIEGFTWRDLEILALVASLT